ncbi:Surface polysaccharide O-acyltransferase, integral membrane enzyme [Amycolatopsis arida]|uniref:Surface polysaccharide O-acyltransferase, integral membrane enzyme n=2 Tax=Amycolatopsis arida TaxID=587909 RepID=A0A1I5XE63_9PSEU|nr:surface polysaccharide O-acyltransferase-like enzyme [Amycolatopsis arida]SFQ30250.1 Surface polysaccharide O-acyltransferase, integral membrane enzyme [Amycolatopsis arida]
MISGALLLRDRERPRSPAPPAGPPAVAPTSSARDRVVPPAGAGGAAPASEPVAPLGPKRIGAVTARRLGRIGWPLLFWSVAYLGLQRWFGAGDPRITEGGPAGMLDAVLLGRPMYHLYYLFIAAGLYLLAPFLRLVVHGLTPEGNRLLAVGALALAVVSGLLDWRLGTGGANAVSLFVPFVGYFLLGHHLANLRPARRRWPWLTVGVLAAAACWGAYLLAVRSGAPAAVDYTESFLHPAAVLAAVALFAGVTARSATGSVGSARTERPSGRTFGVYLAHPVFIAGLGAMLPQAEGLGGGLAQLAALWTAGLAGSLALVMVWERLPLLRKVV